MNIDAAFREFVANVIRDEVRRAVAEATRAEEFLSTSAAAAVADVAPGTIRRWVSDGRLTGHKAGRVIRVSRNELESLLRDGARPKNDLTPEQMAEKLFEKGRR